MEVIRKFTVYEPFSRVYEPGKCLPLAAHALLLLDVLVAHVGFLGGGLLGGGAGCLLLGGLLLLLGLDLLGGGSLLSLPDLGLLGLLGLDLGPRLGAGTTDGLDD